MGLESSSTITGLNTSWPLGTDPRSEGDNHLRLIKTVVKNTFDDSNANALLFKVIGARVAKSTNAVQFEAMQGATVRGQLLWNVGAGIAPLVRLRAYTDAGAVANTLQMDATGVAISVGTLTVPAVDVSGVISGRELTVDPSSAVTGLRILASDANSGRLFLEATTKTWSVAAWESDGALVFSSGGAYGSSTGTARARLHENAVLSVYNQVQATSFLGGPTGAGTISARFGLAGRVGAGAALAWVNAYDESNVEQVRMEITNNILALRPLVATTSALFRITNGSNQRRVELSYSSTNPFSLVARNDSDVLTAALTTNSSGVPFWTYGSGTSSEIITVSTLALTTYTGSSNTNTAYPVGSIISMFTNGVAVARNAAATPCLSNNDTQYYRLSGQPNAGTALPGTWRSRGHIDSNWVLMQKVAD